MPVDAADWSRSFYAALDVERSVTSALREASIAGDLSQWTASLTGLVAVALQRLGLRVAAKGSRCTALPVARQEYLALDVTALAAEGGAWRFPVAVCELENSRRDAMVAYALWKVLCVRTALRVVFCYRAARRDGPGLVSGLANEVVAALSPVDRQGLVGDTLVFVGSRAESSTFPYGFFRAWRLNANTGQFETFAWQK